MGAYPKLLWLLVIFLVPADLSPARAQERAPAKAPASKFLRITKDSKGQPLALETATVRYRPAKGQGDLIVDLVSVVHLGERGYYRKLNEQFEQYDVVLYELVAPKGTRIPKGGRSATDNPLAMIQKIATLVLNLEMQTDRIDYTRQNFLHADMSPAEMAETIAKRGDDGITLFLSIAADMLRQQNLLAMKQKESPAKEESLDFWAMLTDRTTPSKLKRMMAEQLADLESPDGALGKTISTILISDRNKAALKVFQKELAKGKKKIAIFYGAGHMPDFEKRLRSDFGLEPVSTQWATAWDLRIREIGVEDILLRLLEERLRARE
ncbi:MAG TPA: hypothetical protein VKE98_12810 [Gemmataceae bacterium]|nr:hypothetical protein [Gemmataceae bacterium]